MERLTSKDIKWEDGATFAIVDKDSNSVNEQIDFNPNLCVEKWTQIGVFGYAGIYHYQVKR